MPRPDHRRLGDYELLDSDEELTATGNAVGTPSYMAPEQARGVGTAIGLSADIYSLGAIFYRMLTAVHRFKKTVQPNKLMAVMSQGVIPSRKLSRSIHRDPETICLKCLEKNPADR